MSGDANHITSPSPDGDGGYRAMFEALKMASINTDEIDYVNAHGTSTQIGDDIELNAGVIWRNFAGRAITYKGISAGAIYKLNNNLSFKFRISKAKDSASNTVDWDGSEFGIRYHF